jgi:predicted amidohydrolase
VQPRLCGYQRTGKERQRLHQPQPVEIHPFGRIVADMGDREGLEIIYLDLNIVAEAREKLPLIKKRRAEFYAKRLVG